MRLNHQDLIQMKTDVDPKDEGVEQGRDSSGLKGSDRQSEVVELSMQYCAQIL